mgnify:CR=1 FL=1
MTEIRQYFSDIADFRESHKCRHLLSDILIIGLCTYLSNGQDYEDMVIFGQTKGRQLAGLLELPNGVPSHDTFNRVFQILDCEVLKGCLVKHGEGLLEVLAEKQICVDGKKLRGCNPQSRGNRGLYIVNAWVSENRLCIGQQKVCDKSNEIDAIPKLLAEIDITDAVVTMDAMGCQKEIARQVTERQGHYLLAVKENHKELFEEVSCAFKASRPITVSEEWEYDHGRFETRRCSILSAASAIDEQVIAEWAGLRTIVRLEATRTLADKQTTETRYYISDESECNALYFNRLVRGHWAIENHLHWHLDVTFGEDACRARAGNAPENLATLRKLALQILAQHNDRLSLKKRRVKAAYDINYLKSLLN